VGVSVTVTTATPAARAASTSRWTSGVAFWLLRTNALIVLDAICSSTVALSSALGSFPSLIASRNPAGVTRSSPSASASGSTMLSLAPISVPA
jgi:hypothetical protein